MEVLVKVVGTFCVGTIGSNVKLAIGTGSILMIWVKVSAPLHEPGFWAISVIVSVPTLSKTMVGSAAVEVWPLYVQEVIVAFVAPPVGTNGVPAHTESGILKCAETNSL